MSVFWAAFKVHFKVLLHYRTSFLTTIVMDPLFFVINFMIVSSIYRYNQADRIAGYSMTQMLWYFATISFTWYIIYNSTDRNLSDKIVSGALASDLQKPLSVFQSELANAIAIRLLGVAFNLIPSMLLYSWVCFPDFLTWQALLKYGVTAALAFLIYYELCFLIGLSAFAITNNYSMQSIKFFVIILMTGAVIPLDFFPAGFTNLLKFFPFQYLFYWPSQFFLNRPGYGSGELFFKIIMIQGFWCAVLYGLCRFFWEKSIKRFCSAGG